MFFFNITCTAMSNSGDMSETLCPSTSETSGKYSSTLYLNCFKLLNSSYNHIHY